MDGTRKTEGKDGKTGEKGKEGRKRKEGGDGEQQAEWRVIGGYKRARRMYGGFNRNRGKKGGGEEEKGRGRMRVSEWQHVIIITTTTNILSKFN